MFWSFFEPRPHFYEGGQAFGGAGETWPGIGEEQKEGKAVGTKTSSRASSSAAFTNRFIAKYPAFLSIICPIFMRFPCFRSRSATATKPAWLGHLRCKHLHDFQKR